MMSIFISSTFIERVLALASERWRVLDQAHTLRNRVEYHGGHPPSERVLASIRRVALELLRLIRADR